MGDQKKGAAVSGHAGRYKKSLGKLPGSCSRGIYISAVYAVIIWVLKIVSLFYSHRVVKMWTVGFYGHSPQILMIHGFFSQKSNLIPLGCGTDAMGMTWKMQG